MGNLSHIPPPNPGESIKDYMIRNGAHPSCKVRTKSTPEQMADGDKTHTRVGGSSVITVGNPVSTDEDAGDSKTPTKKE